MDSPVKDRSALLRMAGNIAPSVLVSVIAQYENGIKDIREADLALVAYISVEMARVIRDRLDEEPVKEGKEGEVDE